MPLPVLVAIVVFCVLLIAWAAWLWVIVPDEEGETSTEAGGPTLNTRGDDW